MLLQTSSLAINGLAIAMALFLSAAGLTLLFGILRILNFAQGTFIMLGAYVASMFLGQAAFSTGYFILVAVIAGAAIAVVGLAVDFLVFRRLRNVDEAVALIATFALMLAAHGAAKLIFGSNFISINPPASLSRAVVAGPLIVPQFSIFLIVVGIVTFGVLEFALSRLWIGKVFRSVAKDPWVLSLFGYDIKLLVMAAVGISFFLAGFAGGILVPNQTLQPTLGDSFIIQAFTVVIVGGLGSIRGAFLASVLLGIAEAVGSRYFPSLALYLGIVTILLVRPQGLIPAIATAPVGFTRKSFGWMRRSRKERAVAHLSVTQARRRMGRARTRSRDPVSRHAYDRNPALMAIGVLAAIAVMSLPWWASGIMFITAFVMIEAIFAMSWNLMFSYAGLASFGHAAFYSIGAYFVAITLKYDLPIPFVLALGGAGMIGTIVAMGLGAIVLRRSGGLQLAILTLALAEILRILCSYSSLLGYDEGLSAIPRPTLSLGNLVISLQSETNYYLFLCVACGVVAFFLWWVCHSEFGRALRCIHQDPDRAAFIGIDVERYRMIAFVVASGVAAIAGGLSAPLTQIVTPESAGVAKSSAPMLDTLLGGANTFWGPAIGAAVFSIVNYGTRTLAGVSELITGLILLIIILLAPTGIVGLLSTLGHGIRLRVSRRPAS